MKRPLAVYVHIPFCSKHKCFYCNFVSFCNLQNKFDAYFDALVSEIKIQSKNFQHHIVKTIFFGGGTPSCVPAKFVKKTINAIKSNFFVSKNAEVTIEANPESLTLQKLKAYKQAGFNRLSIGAQSTNNLVLQTIGRQHTCASIKKAISCAKKVDYQNINVDMMVGLPNQTEQDCKDMANFLIKNSIPHVSCYSLILEEDTPLFCLFQENKIEIPDADQSVDMYNIVQKTLAKNEYLRYEVSNFAKKGFECKHNQTYWSGGEYVGFGVSAHSFCHGKRFFNTSNFDEYVSKLSHNQLCTEGEEVLSKVQLQQERVMLSLRTKNGIDLQKFKNDFGVDLLDVKKNEVEFLLLHKLIKISKTHLKIANNAFYFMNSIIEKLI